MLIQILSNSICLSLQKPEMRVNRNIAATSDLIKEDLTTWSQQSVQYQPIL